MIDGLSSEYETITYESGTTSNYVSGTFGAASVTHITATTGSITTAVGTTCAYTNVSGATAVRSALVNATNISGVTAIKSAQVTATNISGVTAMQTPTLTATTATINTSIIGSNTGLVIQLPCDAIVSGGMWVTSESGASNLCSPAAASELNPLGIALATTASGATANVLIQGIYYCIANGNISPGDEVGVGAGAALNGVFSISASGTSAGYNRVGKALNQAASGTSATVPVLINLA